MKKTALLAASAVLAVVAGNATAGHREIAAPEFRARLPVRLGPGMLYSQNSEYGYSILSQNFTSGSFGTGYNAAAADDFVIPAGTSWKITGVDVAGQYFVGTGPAKSEVITFFNNAAGRPGTMIGRPQTVNCTDTGGNFACTILAVKLRGGRAREKKYWLSVVANCDSACGEWGWVQNKTTHHSPGQWENPGGGLGIGCTSWTKTSSCIANAADDFAFDLRGKID